MILMSHCTDGPRPPTTSLPSYQHSAPYPAHTRFPECCTALPLLILTSSRCSLRRHSPTSMPHLAATCHHAPPPLLLLRPMRPSRLQPYPTSTQTFGTALLYPPHITPPPQDWHLILNCLGPFRWRPPLPPCLRLLTRILGPQRPLFSQVCPRPFRQPPSLTWMQPYAAACHLPRNPSQPHPKHPLDLWVPNQPQASSSPLNPRCYPLMPLHI